MPLYRGRSDRTWRVVTFLFDHRAMYGPVRTGNLYPVSRELRFRDRGAWRKDWKIKKKGKEESEKIKKKVYHKCDIPFSFAPLCGANTIVGDYDTEFQFRAHAKRGRNRPLSMRKEHENLAQKFNVKHRETLFRKCFVNKFHHMIRDLITSHVKAEILYFSLPETPQA